MKACLFLFFLSLLWSLYTREPLILCLVLIFMALISAFAFGTLNSKWLCYSILLIFLGGMMVVFLYVSSLSLSGKILMPSLSGLAILTLPLPLLVFSAESANFEPSFMSLFAHTYTMSNSPLLFLVIYLLAVLFSAVKATESFKGALMKMW